MTELSFEAHDKPLIDVLFANYKFCIPRFQRPYAWSEDEVTEFWNDLDGNSYPYFLGSFILNYQFLENSGYLEIIDGQQRVLTITIFIAVLRDIVKDIDIDYAKRYQRKCISIEAFDGSETFRVLCGDTTQNFFLNNIQEFENNIYFSEPTTKEEQLIKNNYFYFFEKINESLKQYETNQKKLDYIEKLRDKVSKLIVIQIEISSEEDAYEIFETTNARGVDLNVADLVKNLIFKNIKANEDRDTAKEYWLQIVENIHQTNTELQKFLRYYWISKYSFVYDKQLFRQIKKHITNWDDFLLDLCSDSEWFIMLLEGSELGFKALNIKSSAKIYKSLTAIKSMNVTQCYVLFLSILRNYQKLNYDPCRIFEIIEKFTFTYSAVCKLPTNKVERLFSKYAQEVERICTQQNGQKIVTQQVQSTFSGLENELKSEWPTRETFLESFLDLKYKNSEKGRMLIRYALSEINNFMEETNEKKIDFNNVNIEHLLPQNPDDEWDLNKNEIKNYVNLIGNLTLLGKKINSRIGNKVIKKKIKELSDSQLPITKIVVEELKNNNYIWDREKIFERQKRLAELAYDNIWKYK